MWEWYEFFCGQWMFHKLGKSHWLRSYLFNRWWFVTCNIYTYHTWILYGSSVDVPKSTGRESWDLKCLVVWRCKMHSGLLLLFGGSKRWFVGCLKTLENHHHVSVTLVICTSFMRVQSFPDGPTRQDRFHVDISTPIPRSTRCMAYENLHLGSLGGKCRSILPYIEHLGYTMHSFIPFCHICPPSPLIPTYPHL